MFKKALLPALSLFLILPLQTLAAGDDQLTQLDGQRNETLEKITARLIEGKISPSTARRLKTELDDVVKLESHAREDQRVTTSEVYNVTKCLDKVQSHLNAETHANKVWMGIDNRDKTLHDKIADALGPGKLSKEQAGTLETEYEKLRNREVSGYPTNALEFTDAIAIADDLQSLNNKIDKLIASANSVH